jgi:hypothetical protein
MLLFILISGIFLFSCEKDKETENPDADDNTEDPVPEDPDSSDSFDQNGGTLEWEAFSLERNLLERNEV